MRRTAPFIFYPLLVAVICGWVYIDPWPAPPIVKLDKPAYLVSFTEPTFGTTVTRISGDRDSNIPFTDSNAIELWGSMRHHYQKDQPWSSDGALLMMTRYDSAGDSNGSFLFNGNTYAPLRPLSSACAGDRWSPDPNFPTMRIGISGDKIQWYDVSTCVKQFEWDTDVTILGGVEQEGNLSDNGRYIAVYDANNMQVIDLNPYDPNAYRKGPLRTLTDCGILKTDGTSACASLDWVSISPSAEHVVISVGDNLKVYDVDPNLVITFHAYDPNVYECYYKDPNSRGSDTNYPTGADPNTGSIFGLGHADMSLADPAAPNDETIIGQRRSWCPNPPSGSGTIFGNVQRVDLGVGDVYGLTLPKATTDDKQEASSHHISTRARNRPLWAYVTYFASLASNGKASHPTNRRRYENEVIAVHVDGSGDVERFARTHALKSGCTRCEEQAVPDPNGNRIIFASNWMLDCLTCDPNTYATNDVNVQAYVIDTTALRGDPYVPGGEGRQIWVIEAALWSLAVEAAI